MIGDGGNLYVRIHPSTSSSEDKRNGKDWWFRYEANGKKSKLALGSYTDVSLKEAREKAAEFRKLIVAGIDPKLRRAEQKAERDLSAAVPQTVQEAFDLWKVQKLTLRKDGGKEVVRMFNKDVLKVVGKMPLQSLRRRHVMAILNAVSARGSKRMTGQLLTELRQFVKFTIKSDWIEADITAVLEAADWDGQSKPRIRALSDDEIIELADKLAKCGIKKTTAAAIWIMLSTMCRVGALEAANWDDIDFKKKTWQAARKSRDEEEYTIFLSPFALRQFEVIKADQEDLIRRKREREEHIDADRFQWVFPAKNPRSEGEPKHVTKKTLSKQILNFQTDKQWKNRPPVSGALKLSGGSWSAHDLRRTGSTIMARTAMKIPDPVRELCLNHAPKNPLDRAYNQNKYEAEMRAAWEALGRLLESLRGAADSTTA